MITIINGPNGTGRTTKAIEYYSNYPRVLVWDTHRTGQYNRPIKFNIYNSTSMEYFSIMARSTKAPVIIDDLSDVINDVVDNITDEYFGDKNYHDNVVRTFEDNLLYFLKECLLSNIDVILVMNSSRPPRLDRLNKFLSTFPQIDTTTKAWLPSNISYLTTITV